ncbi:MAG: alpha/beta hydrolase [Chitinophagaceae bacterium]|nr:MAG: alpha/beta hydrolase [Chitinophagaceae bacterium]
MKEILLLHGAIGSKEQLQPLADLLAPTFNVHLLNLPGHGGVPFPAGGFSIDHFAEVVLQYLDNNKIKTISIFGYSMGGYVAMLLAKQYPNRIAAVITLATKFHWDELSAAKEIKMLQPDILEQKVPAFAAELARRHAPLDWKEQLLYTQKMLKTLGDKNVLTLEDYEYIDTKCLLMLGDRDKMVPLRETTDVFNQLPKGSLALLPNTGHPIEQTDPEVLHFFISRFLKT